MIPVDRAAVPAPPSLHTAMTNQNGERAAARAHYGPPPPAKAYGFTAYKGTDVKLAIEDLFHNKCAYCETHHGAGGPVDIEHYRPKGAVADDPAHPGYWWLAMAWDNLLYSCLDCNRMRGQIIVTPGMTQEEVQRLRQDAERTNAGKKDAFPIRGARLQPEDDAYHLEDALLIDPTRANPGQHLTFVADAEDRCLAIATGTADAPDPYGQASIQIYGLNRSVLVDARTMLWKKLRVQGEFIKDFLDEFVDATTAEAKERAKGRAVRHWAEIESWADPTQPYSAMVRVFLNNLKQELGWDET